MISTQILNRIQEASAAGQAQFILDNAVSLQQEFGVNSYISAALQPAVAAAVKYVQGAQGDTDRFSEVYSYADQADKQFSSLLSGSSYPLDVRALCETMVILVRNLRSEAAREVGKARALAQATAAVVANNSWLTAGQPQLVAVTPPPAPFDWGAVADLPVKLPPVKLPGGHSFGEPTLTTGGAEKQQDARKAQALKAYEALSAADLADCIVEFAKKSGLIQKPAGVPVEAYFAEVEKVHGKENLINLGYDILIKKQKAKADLLLNPIFEGAKEPGWQSESDKAVAGYKASAKALPQIGYNNAPLNMQLLMAATPRVSALNGQQILDAAFVFAAAVGAFDKKAGDDPAALGKLIEVRYGQSGLADLAEAVLAQAEAKAKQSKIVPAVGVLPLVPQPTPPAQQIPPPAPVEPDIVEQVKKSLPTWAIPAGIGALALLAILLVRKRD